MAISPSAIEKYELCERRYFWNYVLKDWEPQTQTPAAEAGSAVHKFLETAAPITLAGYDIIRLGARMRNHIPENLTDVRKEHKFRETVEGIEFSGIVDLLSAEYIVDYKTSGSDAKYAKTDRKLLNDPQRLIYAAAHPGVPRSRWITGLWRDYSVVIGERENVPEDRERFRLHVLAPAEKMLALAQTPGIDPLSLPLPGKQDKYTGLTKACNAFGKPCPRIDRCFPKKRLKLSLPAPVSASVGLPQSKPAFTFPLLDTEKSVPVEITTAFVLTGPFSLSGSVAVDLPQSKQAFTFPLLDTGKSVPVETTTANDEDFVPVSGSRSALYQAAEEVCLGALQKSWQEFQDEAGKQILGLLAKSASPLVTDKGETRTTEDFVLAGSGDAEILSADKACPVVTDKGEIKTVKPKYLIENLYIDCMPIVPYPPGESLEYSYEYVAAAGAEVASDMGVASPMLVDFGKGPHLVTAQLIANLSDRSEPIKHLFLETRSAEGRACMQELTSRAKSVVKGCY